MSLFGALFGKAGEARTISAWGDWSPSRGDASNVNERTAYTLSAVWACQTLIADTISTLPVDTFRKTDTGSVEIDKPEWVEQPNPIDNRVDYDTQRLLSLLGWGNSFSMIVPKMGGLERWPIDPWRVTVQREGYSVSYLIDGQPVPAANIHHIRGYVLPGTSVGMSVVEHARRSLGMSAAAEEFGSNFFTRGVNPSGVLEMPQMPAETAADNVERLREQFASRYGGMANSHRPAVLTGGTTWKQITVNPSDAQFLETRMFQVEEVCRWYRVPPHEISHITNNASQGGGNGIEAQSLNLARRTLAPWIVRLEHADNRLLREGFLKYNIDAFVRADIKTRYESYAIGRTGGWLSVNNVREWENMTPIDNGDIFLQPLNYEEAGAVPVAAPAPEPVPDVPDPTRALELHVHQGDTIVERSTINVDATSEPAVVNVAAAEVNVPPTVVNLPDTIVNIPEQAVVVDRGTVTKTVVRDEHGTITGSVEERS